MQNLGRTFDNAIGRLGTARIHERSIPGDTAVTNLKAALLTKIQDIEGVTAQPSPVSGGTALFYRGKEFAHFHHDTEIDLRLTKKVIQAMGLTHPQGSVQHPARAAGSPWIEVRFEDAAGVQRAVELIRIAANQL